MKAPLACALIGVAFPMLVAARARVKGIIPMIGKELADTSNSSVIWITVAPGQQIFFEPPNPNATVGQTVNFMFPSDLPVSVTQSSFNDPCTYLNTSDETGFDSQLQESIVFSLEILDSDPIYFHCKHPGHCGQGMVGTINAPTSGNETFTIYQTKAVSLGSNAPNDTNVPGSPVAGSSGAIGSTLPASTVAPTPSPTSTFTSDAAFSADIRTRIWPAWVFLALVFAMATA
ncbi:hypothetical protein K488DRAFT_81573 [Vararia minispora EC-137]|uniref:Uncharacterized protein n=1 Tax=Vararia minispora EC-137 TaxID=1314806 RepID=A0ACB8QZ41_9AGAM|nr:hypothetical protein K488DRAFT_81573 [Vararia minispora EC-137]